ncbi:MAG: hypothetical protein ACK4ZD_14040 [Caldimonas sp.]|uniref:hypothetical protein n=1 Tax=Caldimonas TaxID=196013 RepID=UPI0012E9BFE6|nr:hypothetical protein [Caldimonas manganoxidans]
MAAQEGLESAITGRRPRGGGRDRDDLTVPVADGERLAAALPGSRLMLTSGLGHRRTLQDPAVVAEVVRTVHAWRTAP